jgi:hypothetical protein
LLLDDGNAVPITASGGFITLNAENTQLTVLPTKPADVGTWTIFATQDTASGPNLNFEAI